jgi:hypothetical protein
MMIFKFHVPVKTEGAVAVACSDLLGDMAIPLCKIAPDEKENQRKYD